MPPSRAPPSRSSRVIFQRKSPVAVCQALAASLHLLVAGVDLRQTLDDRWYCFEVNPSPAFTYFQEATHQAMDEAIARLLAAGEEISETFLT